jgi:glutathione S-transferase
VLKVYGHPQTRSFRVLWMVEELGIPYEHEPLRGPETRKPEYLRINPNGHVPAIQDGDVVLWESMAINLYLASKYGREKGLWPASPEDQGRAIQWSFWAMTEVEPLLMELFRQRVTLPEAQRSADAAKAAEEKLGAPLRVLDAALDGRPHLLGGEFSVADLNVAAVLSWVRFLRIDLSAVPRVADWIGRALNRPLVRKAQGR